MRTLALILAFTMTLVIPVKMAYAGYCTELRLACEHKGALGETGAGNCKAYRAQCSRPVYSCSRMRYLCLHKDAYGLRGAGYCQSYRSSCR